MKVVKNYIKLTKGNCKKVGMDSLALLFLLACAGSVYIGLSLNSLVLMLILIPVFLLIDVLIMNALY